MVPLDNVTDWPDEIAVALIIISVPLVPTVKPETITLPALSRNSALAAVPVPLAVDVKGVPEIVNTPLDTVPGVVPSVNVTSKPVAPESADVPITNEPADAVPLEAVCVLPATKSATSCIRLFFNVDEYTTDIG